MEKILAWINKYPWINKYLGTGLAIRLADWLGTVCCIYGVFFLVTIPLRWQTPTDIMGWLTWLIQTLFQGVALPILGVSQKVESRKLMMLLQETHDSVMRILKEIHVLMKEIHLLLKDLHRKTPEVNRATDSD